MTGSPIPDLIILAMAALLTWMVGRVTTDAFREMGALEREMGALEREMEALQRETEATQKPRRPRKD